MLYYEFYSILIFFYHDSVTIVIVFRAESKKLSRKKENSVATVFFRDEFRASFTYIPIPKELVKQGTLEWKIFPLKSRKYDAIIGINFLKPFEVTLDIKRIFKTF